MTEGDITMRRDRGTDQGVAGAPIPDDGSVGLASVIAFTGDLMTPVADVQTGDASLGEIAETNNAPKIYGK